MPSTRCVVWEVGRLDASCDSKKKKECCLDPPSRSPARLFVTLHVLQVLALLCNPTLDTPFKYQTLHGLVRLLLDVVCKPRGCTIAPAARGTCRKSASNSPLSTPEVKGRRTAIPNNLTNTSSLEESVKRRDRRVKALSRQIDGALNGTALRSGQNASVLRIPGSENSLPRYTS
jgi:hypothetical protein